MADPDKVDRFAPKLNKRVDGGVHAVEEELAIVDGRYEGYLAHDNIVNSTVRVYTGLQFSGVPVTTWTLSTPADMPWRRIIRVFASVPSVYATYETPGDTVDADDVNALQEAIEATQERLEAYKASGTIDGGSFYEGE